jgi:hypothetical protein
LKRIGENRGGNEMTGANSVIINMGLGIDKCTKIILKRGNEMTGANSVIINMGLGIDKCTKIILKRGNEMTGANSAIIDTGLGIDKCTKIILKRGKLVDRQKCDDWSQQRNTRAEQERT